MTCVALRDAPSSHSKKAMIAFAVLVSQTKININHCVSDIK